MCQQELQVGLMFLINVWNQPSVANDPSNVYRVKSWSILYDFPYFKAHNLSMFILEIKYSDDINLLLAISATC